MIEADRDKLVKLLRMFSSDFDGEVASAARRAHELVKSRALDWADLIVTPGNNAGSQKSRDHNKGHDRRGSPIDDIRHCRELNDYVTDWEKEFLDSIAGSIVEWGRLTEKQRAVLDRIVNKLKLAGLWDVCPW